MHTEQVADPSWPPATQQPHLDDAPFDAPRYPSRTVMRTRRAIAHPDRTRFPIPARPTVRGGLRNLKPLCCPTQRPAILNDTTRQPQPARLRQRGITVDHEDLQWMSAFLDSSHFTRRSSPCHPATPSPTSVVSTPSRLLAARLCRSPRPTRAACAPPPPARSGAPPRPPAALARRRSS